MQTVTYTRLAHIHWCQGFLYEQLEFATPARRIKINMELDRLANEERRLTCKHIDFRDTLDGGVCLNCGEVLVVPE